MLDFAPDKAFAPWAKRGEPLDIEDLRQRMNYTPKSRNSPLFFELSIFPSVPDDRPFFGIIFHSMNCTQPLFVLVQVLTRQAFSMGTLSSPTTRLRMKSNDSNPITHRTRKYATISLFSMHLRLLPTVLLITRTHHCSSLY